MKHITAAEVIGIGLFLAVCGLMCYGTAWIFVLVGVPN